MRTTMRTLHMKAVVLSLAWLFWAGLSIQAVPDGPWSKAAPREEIRPVFKETHTGGKSGHGGLSIIADEREGLHGWWQKTVYVNPGEYYRFTAWYREENVPATRRSVLPRVLWRDDANHEVKRPTGVV